MHLELEHSFNDKRKTYCVHGCRMVELDKEERSAVAAAVASSTSVPVLTAETRLRKAVSMAFYRPGQNNRNR